MAAAAGYSLDTNVSIDGRVRWYPPDVFTRVWDQVHALIRANRAVISDEVYDRLVLDDSDYPSAVELAPDLEQVIVASCFSKTYSMPGLRVGWLR